MDRNTKNLLRIYAFTMGICVVALLIWMSI